VTLRIEGLIGVLGALPVDPSAQPKTVLLPLLGDPCVTLALHEALQVGKRLIPGGLARVPTPSGKVLQEGLPLWVERSIAVLGALVCDPLAQSKTVRAVAVGDACVALAPNKALEVGEALVPGLCEWFPSPPGEGF